MQINYENIIPTQDEFFNLFETTGWNEKYNFNKANLFKAINNSWYVLSAFHDGKLIGFGRIISDGVYQTLIGDLIVHPDYQGKGIGSRLVVKLVNHCKESGIKCVQLTSARGKKGFYQKLGFTERPVDGPGMEMLFAKSLEN